MEAIKSARYLIYTLVVVSMLLVGGHYFTAAPDELFVRIIAIHDKVENGGTVIDIQEMYKGMESYEGKPVLLDHEYGTAYIIGEVLTAYPSLDAEDNSMCLELVAVIKDPYAIDMILNGMFKSVSVGFYAEVAECTVCGEDYFSGECMHWPGTRTINSEGEYVVVKYIMREIEFLEISIVAVPADRDARIADFDDDFEDLMDRAADEIASRYIVIPN